MGLDSNRPPLPAPTDISSADDTTRGVIDDVSTDVSRVTDKTSYSIPEDGSPVTITTRKANGSKDQSQTSLLIEYFEGSRSGDNLTSRPSVRVRVTPSASRKAKNGKDHIQISESSKSRRPTYTRRISIPSRSSEAIEGTQLSQSSGSSSRPPVEVEVLQNSELSQLEDNRFVPVPSDISLIPPDSLLDGESRSNTKEKESSNDLERLAEGAVAGAAGAAAVEHLTAPHRSRSRSLSRERITQKVMEKLKADSGRAKESSSKHKSVSSRDRSSRSGSVGKDRIVEDAKSPRRSGKDREYLGTESNLNPSELSGVSGVSGRSGESMRSGISNTSINNPKLLHAVEDAIKRLILPELNALKEEQNLQKKRMKYEELSRDSRVPADSRESSRLSKTSSLPDVSRKPGIVTDDRGVVLESSKHRKSRRSSKESDKSYDTAAREESSRRRSSREKSHTKEAALAAGVAGAAAGLTAANLKHHDSMSSVEHERRKKRTKGRSRTTSMSESIMESPKRERVRHRDRDGESIPSLPMQSTMESDVTRESILSAETERPESGISRDEATSVREHEVREVSRGSPRQVTSASPRTPTRKRTPVTLRESLGTHHDNASPVDFHTASPQERQGMAAKAEAALVAAGAVVGAAAATKRVQENKEKGFEQTKTQHIAPARHISPVQSDTSYREEYAQTPIHDRVRSIKSGESMSSSRKMHRKRSGHSAESVPASPTVRKAKDRPQGVSLERGYEILPDEEYRAETPQQSDVDEWFDRNHEQNEAYRSELGSRHGHYDPSVESGDGCTLDSAGEHHDGFYKESDERDIRYIGANPEYVHTPVAVESAVASLQEPSSISIHSSGNVSPIKGGHLSQADSLSINRGIPPTANGEARQQTSKERWEAIRDQAIAQTQRYQHGGVIEGSSRRSTPRSLNERPVMGASAIPVAGEDMPEIGMGLDDEDDLTTNPSVIQGPIGGLDHGDRSHWPYEPTPNIETARELDVEDDRKRDGLVLGSAAAAATGAAIGLGLANAQDKGTSHEYAEETRDFQPTIEEEDEAIDHEVPGAASPYGKQPMYMSSPGMKDEGYVTGVTPDPYTPVEHALDALDESALDQFGVEDPFTTAKHLKHESGLSHGMDSPLYDAATGKGIDRIQSRDIVALMDHLTVRDAQRNARDTEILVTLVRSAAEMRNSFEEMKKFIAEQDRMIMHNIDRDADITVQKVLSGGHTGGPRPMPEKTVRAMRSQTSEDTDVQTKRRNIFRRALKGLTLRSSNDLKNIEEMLMQLLDEVEGLKTNQNLNQAPQGQSLDSYERLRLPTDPGYEPEGRAGTESTPNQSGYLSNHSSRRLMHSGFDHDRRGSDGHRISTVLEGDEDIDNQNYQPPNGQQTAYEDTERLDTPTQEVHRGQSLPMETPPEQSAQFRGSQGAEDTPGTSKSRKHKSTVSSLFSGFPKSRWSKTTASTEPDSATPSGGRKDDRALSEASQSGSQINMQDGYNDDYELREDDRLHSQNSLLAQQQAAQQPRSPSPLIPEERRSMEHPKYHAHRNSLNLQHPQPRPGPTHRHQTYLESQAVNYENPPTPDQEDLWGSGPTIALNRNRFSNGSASNAPALSPVYSDHSASEQAHQQPPTRPPKVRDDGPLVPPKEPIVPPKEPEEPFVPIESSRAYESYSNQLAAGQVHIPSPLEPIQEVRYSLETDRNSELRQALTPSPHPTTARAMQSSGRKITGPREMPQSSSSVRRKQVPVQQENLVPAGNGGIVGPRADEKGSPASGKRSWPRRVKRMY